MTATPPTAPGWYPDPDTDGTKYWEGSRWTGDVRPPRRAFAAPGHEPLWAGMIAMMGGSFGFLQLMGYAESSNGVYLVLGVGILMLSGAACIYMLRGRGPSTQEIQTRLAEERKEANARRLKANVWGVVAGLGRIVRPTPPATSRDAAAAQIDAISNPQTAQALQNLQKLLYTRAITDDEFREAKAKLVGDADDTFAHITKLAELYEAGILGDVEFAAAKAKALRL